MYRLEKFYKEGFNASEYWDTKYASELPTVKTADGARKQQFWPLLEENLTKTGRYLDAGCGIGGWMIFLKDEGYDIEGIDVAAKTIRAITEYDPDAKVRVAAMTQIPYKDTSFDGLLAIGTLEYLENNVVTGIREAHRVLKPGGFFFIEVPVANPIRRLLYLPLKAIQKMLKAKQGQTPVFAGYLFTRSEMKTMLEDAGFTVEAEQPHEVPKTDGHYGLYVDWKFLRGSKPYHLNVFGKLIQLICDSISPWIASTGAIIVAKKK